MEPGSELTGRISLMSLIFWRNFCLSGRQRTEAPSAATAPKSIREASYRRSYADSFTLATCFYPCLRGVRDDVFIDFLDIGLRYHLLTSTLRVCLGAFSCAWATPNNAWQSIRKFLPSTGVHSLMACIDSSCQCRDWPGSSLT